jgi:hypothetical protein
MITCRHFISQYLPSGWSHAQQVSANDIYDLLDCLMCEDANPAQLHHQHAPPVAPQAPPNMQPAQPPLAGALQPEGSTAWLPDASSAGAADTRQALQQPCEVQLPGKRSRVRPQDLSKASEVWRYLSTGQGLEGVPVVTAPLRDPPAPGAPRYGGLGSR